METIEISFDSKRGSKQILNDIVLFIEKHILKFILWSMYIRCK